jgi:hypothetical protein
MFFFALSVLGAIFADLLPKNETSQVGSIPNPTGHSC